MRVDEARHCRAEGVVHTDAEGLLGACRTPKGTPVRRKRTLRGRAGWLEGVSGSMGESVQERDDRIVDRSSVDVHDVQRTPQSRIKNEP